jgi:CubicO group peptidase (beta-lactamase class C family)
MKPFSLFALAVSCATSSFAADLPRSSPESQGVSSRAVLGFVEAADKNIDSFHSIMIVRHGQVIAEGWWAPYRAETPHMLFSLSKSFTSTAVGLAISEGKLKLDDEVVKLFPDDVPANANANLKNMRISDLLRMNTGHQTEPPRKADEAWTKTFLAHAVPFKPGTHFLYNTSATYMQSAAVQKATGQNLLEYLKPRLFDPLGIENPTWEMSPQGIATGGYGLSVRTEDIAKFGQLYLQKGKWNGKQLVPEAWVEAATARQTSNGSNPKSDWDQGYGYQFWRCRHGAYRGDGAFGQYCIVMPEQDTVIAITSGVRDMQAVMNLVWDKLLPAMTPSALPADPDSQTKLERTLKSLSLKPPAGSASAAKGSDRQFLFPANPQKLESIMLKTEKDGSVAIHLKVNGNDRKLLCTPKQWQPGRTAWGRITEQPVGSSGAWTADDTFTAKICFTHTPFIATVKLKFTGDEVRCESEMNVGFGPTKEAPLVGKAE